MGERENVLGNFQNLIPQDPFHYNLGSSFAKQKAEPLRIVKRIKYGGVRGGEEGRLPMLVNAGQSPSDSTSPQNL